MSEKRFIRNIMGDIYDSKNDKWFEEDWKGKPLDYDDDLIVFLNEQEDSMTELRNILFAKEKTIDRLENTLLHLTEADGYLEKNRKITELADIGYNVKMVLSNDKEQLAKVINKQQAEIERLKKELDEKCP